jgi:hypothetical protein
MTVEEKKELFELKALKEKKAKEKLTLTEALAQSEKEQSELTDDDDDYGRDISVQNPSKRAEKLQKEFEEGLQNTPAKSKVWKYTYEQKGNGPEKQFVKEEYKGKCQICGRDAIIKYNGQKYFEAINIINTNLLKDVYLNNLETGWNTLCLCPNCAAEYRYCAKNLNELEKQVEEIVVESRKNEMIDINISLKGQKTKIHFTPKHVIALKAAFKIFKEHEQNN